MKKVLVFLMVAVIGFGLASCGPRGEVQGITKDEIVIGNTAATSGLFAGVGVPFNLAMQVVFDEYNAITKGPKIRFVHYDDGFDGETGLALTKKLVEEDKVFALVGHFGTNTVESTMDYLLEKEIPMVYGVTGVNSLYYEGATQGELGYNILSVQPIYRTEGRMMVARALHENLFGENGNAKLGANDKIVVLYSEDDAGTSIKAGIEDEMKAQSVPGTRVSYIPFTATNASSVVSTALAQNPGVILLSANQAPATAAATALREQNSTVAVLSSYVNSAAVFTPAMAKTPLVVEGVEQKDAEGNTVMVNVPLPYNVYANAWVDIVDPAGEAPKAEDIGEGFQFLLPGFTPEYWEFVRAMWNSDREDGDVKAKDLWADPYAMAGYIAAKSFVTVLERVKNFNRLDWNTFIELAASEPISLPMAGTIDWKDGSRVGLDTLALTKFGQNSITSLWEFAKVRNVESIDQVNKK